MCKAYLIQHFNFRCSPPCNSTFTLTESHFFESLGNAILRILSTSVMPDRNIVNMQMRCGFVHVQDGIEYHKVWITFLIPCHVLFQAISHKLSIFCIHSGIFFSADLHDIFIEAFAFVGSCYNGISGFPMEQRFIVTAMDFSVVSFLSGVVSSG